jgi:acetyl esterase/lipase
VLPEDGCPIFVVYHGGGFVLGDLDDEATLCRNFTQLGGIAVNVDYRLAPEHPFPVPIEDAFDALKWVCHRRFPTELG